MDIEEIIAYSLSKKSAEDSFPFDDTILLVEIFV